ncbi:MAG: caspase family protein [Spirochaetales bacterium]
MFFYAGHGVQINGQNYLIPIKETFETPDDVIHDALALQTVTQAFEDAKAGVDIVILDACRDNPFNKKNSRSLGGTRGLSIVNKSPNIEGSAVLFSTAPGDTASDGSGRNGVFTQALLKYIKSDLKLQDIVTKVTKDVKTATGGKQSPYNSMSLSDDFYLVPVSMRKPSPEPPSLTQAPVGTANPLPSAGTDLRASLTLQKSTLVKVRQTAKQGTEWTAPVSLAGWATTAAGAALAGYAVFDATTSYAAANAASSQAGFDAVRAKIPFYNTLLNGGGITAGVGLLLAAVGMVLSPDVSGYDRQIADIDKTLSKLETP